MTRPAQEVTVPFNEDILARAKRNSSFREVVSTGPHAQVARLSPRGQPGPGGAGYH